MISKTELVVDRAQPPVCCHRPRMRPMNQNLLGLARRPSDARIGRGVNLTLLRHRHQFVAIGRGCNDPQLLSGALARRPTHTRIGRGVNLAVKVLQPPVCCHRPRMRHYCPVSVALARQPSHTRIGRNNKSVRLNGDRHQFAAIGRGCDTL